VVERVRLRLPVVPRPGHISEELCGVKHVAEWTLDDLVHYALLHVHQHRLVDNQRTTLNQQNQPYPMVCRRKCKAPTHEFTPPYTEYNVG